MPMKKAERHRAVDKHVLFQNSVYLFSLIFLNNQTVSGRHIIISSCCFDLLIHFRGWCQRMATLDTSFWRPFKLYNSSLENAYICFLIIYGLLLIEMVKNSNPMHFDQYEYLRKLHVFLTAQAVNPQFSLHVLKHPQ